MSRQKTLSKGKLISVYLEDAHIKHIQRMAHSLSLQLNENVSTSRAIRMILEQLYPSPEPKQLDLFSKPKRRRILKKEKENFLADGTQGMFSF